MKLRCWNGFLNRCLKCFFELFFAGVFLTISLTGCTTTYAPVEHRNKASYSVKKKHIGKTPAFHIVKKGDTLYSIAWMYGLDYKSLAYKNRIKPPYLIHKGKRIRLATHNSKRATKKVLNKTKVSGTNGRYKSGSSTKTRATTGTPTRSRKSNTTNFHKTSTKTRNSGKNKSTTRAVKNAKKTATYTGSKRLNWKWPVKGKIIQRYSPGSGKKGIDISASKGTLIRSAEAGKVVYSGHGLLGYGQLIIIKHNDTYLSAYAHNQSLLVNEGQLVKKGQNIARLGRSGTDRYKLHFEIRKNGKPVNPMNYLPR